MLYDYRHYEFINNIKGYIEVELGNYFFYAELAKLAPTGLVKQTISDFSSGSKATADDFQAAYFTLTGGYYRATPMEAVMITNYDSALNQCLLKEKDGYRQYGAEYLKAHTKFLQDLFFRARTIKAQQAMRMHILFEEDIVSSFY